MRLKTLILWFVTVASLMAGLSVPARADGPGDREHQIKAAFLYNFIAFVGGPRFDQLGGALGETVRDPNTPIVIGLLGQDAFGTAFDPLKKKHIRGHPVSIRRFKGFGAFRDSAGRVITPYPQLDKIKACHVLFVGPSEKVHFDAIVESIGSHAILTVADTPGFLEAGGMINFVVLDKKVRFEINTAAAARAKLKIRSKLLRLAKRVIEQDKLSRNHERGNEAKRDGKQPET